MANIQFKLEEELLSTTKDITVKMLKNIGKSLGSELVKVALSPLTGSYENSDKYFKEIVNFIDKRDIYTAEKKLEKYVDNMMSGYVVLLKNISILGPTAFSKEKFNNSELNILENILSDFIKENIKHYRSEIKRAIEHNHNPPKFEDKQKLISSFNKRLKREIESKYKSDRVKYYRLDKWFKGGSVIVGTTLAKLVASGIQNLYELFIALEVKSNKLKGK